MIDGRKSNLKIALFILFVLLGYNVAFTQIRNETPRPWKLKNYGNKAIQSGDIYLAIDYFEKYCSLKPDKNMAAYTLAALYEKSRDYAKSAKQYRKVYKADSIKFIYALYKYALMLKSECHYDSALIFFNQYKNQNKNLRSDKMQSALLVNDIEGCTLALKANEKKNNIKIIHLDTSINKPHVEFSPMSIDDNTFLYASLRSDSMQSFVDELGHLRMPVREFYKAIKKHDQWVGGYESPFPGNELNVNVGNGVLSMDGNRFYYTRCEELFGNKLICAINMCKKNNGKWGKPEKLGNKINLPNYTSTQPAIGSNLKNNNEILYFVSDRKNGKGGLDLWYAEYDIKKNIFKTPKNCGGTLNTPANEMTPFYDFDTHSLYFSSSWFPGFGGLDVFRSTGELKSWSKPENIGTPINSCADDIYYVVAKNRDDGFFVSNRKGGVALKSETCCDDIYSFTELNKIKLYAQGHVMFADSNIIDGIMNDKTFKDTARCRQPVKNKIGKLIVSLHLYDKELKQRFLVSTDTTNEIGEYIFKIEPEKEYIVTVDTANFLSRETHFNTYNMVHSDTLKLKPIALMKIPIDPIIIRNIYYPFDKSFLTDDAMKCIDSTVFFVMKNLPEIIVEISSHSDNKGNDDYNRKLSQQRAESVVHYLITKGIAKDRLIAKGYGMLQPIAPNFNSDGTDNPYGMAKNRRTEFRIVGSLKEKYFKVREDD